MALGQFGLRFKIGHHHAQLIEYFLDRAANPTLEKMEAHYPVHPRSGAPELHSNAHFGICVANALNVKRGFWRISPNLSHSNGVSPYGSTPESAAYASSSAGHGQPSSATSASGGGSSKSATINRMNSGSPRSGLNGVGYGLDILPTTLRGPGDAHGIEATYRFNADKRARLEACDSVVDGQVTVDMFFEKTGLEPNLTADMEKRFDSVSDVVDGQRSVFSTMFPGGSFTGQRS